MRGKIHLAVPAVSRELSLEVFHLIPKNVLVVKNESLVQTRDVRNVQKLHLRFFRCPVVLPVVTACAGSNQVRPAVVATSALWLHVVTSQLCAREVISAVCTDVMVPTVQHFGLSERNILATFVLGDSGTADSDDTLDRDDALFTRTLESAVEDNFGVTKVVLDVVSCVVVAGFFNIEPLVWVSCYIKREYAVFHGNHLLYWRPVQESNLRNKLS